MKSKKPQSEIWPLIIGVLALLFAVFEIYEPALNGPYLYDDLNLPMLIPGYEHLPLSAWVSGLRPMLMMTLWLNFKLFGIETFSFHFVNLLLHMICGLLVWLIARKLAPQGFALFVTVVFLVHPLQTESVAYIASRSEVASALVFLGAWAVFLYRKEAAIAFSEAFLVLILFVIALATKEHTAVLPAVLLLTDYYAGGFTAIKRNYKVYLPLLIAAAAGAAAVFVIVLGRADTAGFGLKDLPWYQYLFTQFRTWWVYLRLFVLPVGLNLDYDMPVSRTLLDYGSGLCLISFLVLGFLAWRHRKDYPYASFGFFLFLILLAPTSSIVPIRDVIAERRMYLPVFALALASCDFLRRIKISRPALTAALGAVCLVLMILTWQRTSLYGSAVTIWADAAAKSPNKARPHFQLAYAYYQQGLCADALREYQTTGRLQPHDYQLSIDWALAADCANQPGEALDRLDEILKSATLHRTERAHAYSLIGMVKAKRAEYDDALAALGEAEKLNPRFAMTFVYRGNILLAKKEFDQALANFNQALAIEPGMQAAIEGRNAALKRS